MCWLKVYPCCPFWLPRSLALTAGKWASSLGTTGPRDPAATNQVLTEPSLANSTQSEVQDEPGPAAGAEARFEPGQLPTDRKVGICELPWESAAREALMSWLQERGWGDSKVGGKHKKQRKSGKKMDVVRSVMLQKIQSQR